MVLDVGLFGTEAFDGVGKGGFQGLEADGKQGDQQDARAAGGKDPPREGSTIRIVEKPAVHAQINEGYRNQHREEDELQEIAGEEGPEVDHACTENLADAGPRP